MNDSNTMTVAEDMCDEVAPPQTGVRLVGLADLRAKMASDDDMVMVMAMDQRRFETAHIAGSISFDTMLEELPHLDRDRELVVYCTGPQCAASKLRAAFLVDAGFTAVSRFPGGLQEWAQAGLPLASSRAQ